MSATRLELLASGAQTATAQGSGITVANLAELAVMADVTAASGTLTVYLQSSNDGGTTWFDVMAESACVLTTGVGPGTTGTDVRNIFAGSVTAAAKGYAKYKTFGDYVRAAWIISGSGATFTFSVKAVGKT